MPIDTHIGQGGIYPGAAIPDETQIGGQTGLSPPPASTPSRNPALDAVTISAASASPSDKQAFLESKNIKAWDAGKIYSPGDLVVYKNEVYQATAAGKYTQGFTPGENDRQWLFHGTVDNNYNYYMSKPSAPPNYVEQNNPTATSPATPVAPVGSNLSQQNSELATLQSLKNKFPEAFKVAGNSFSSKIRVDYPNGPYRDVKEVHVHGGSNQNGSGYSTYFFKSVKQDPEFAKYKPWDAHVQFVYLRPEDRGKIGEINPENYKFTYRRTDEFDLRFGSEGHDVPGTAYATYITPKTWTQRDINESVPDFGYLYEPSYKEAAQQDQSGDGSRNFTLQNDYDQQNLPAIYEGL